MSIGLILEGGGTRGAYTAGVLDVLAENNIFFPTIYGVSAGACNAMSYISKQNGRNHRIFIEYASDKRYLSVRTLLKTGGIFGFDFIFGELAHELLPFDYEEFFRSSMNLWAGATDCMTGEAVFFDKREMKKEDFSVIIASSSLPMVSKTVAFKGRILLDGGVAAPIPIEYAMRDGFSKNVVVMTREREYVKSSKPDVPEWMLKRKYQKYPMLLSAMRDRPDVYNREKELCRQQEEQANALIIAPSSPVTIGRYCTQPDKLEKLYQLGVADAKNKLAEVRRFVALNGF